MINQDSTALYKNKNILITGVAGSIGFALAKKLLSMGVTRVIGIDNNESALYFVEQTLGSRFSSILGDIRDTERFLSLSKNVDILFHVAAFKHVPLCERHPIDAVKTNILGVQNIIEASKRASVPRVVFTSTDKAVNPTNVMGASKLMGEQLIKAANLDVDSQIFLTTRFGNVLGSRGSVVPIFHKQISSGGPITITSNEMTRFVMTLEEAVNLVLGAPRLAKGGEVFITKMRAIQIRHLAEVMIEELAPRYGFNPKEIEIEEIGPRSGEKSFEELMTEEEVRRSVELDDYFVVLPALTDLYRNKLGSYSGSEAESVLKPYTSRTQDILSKSALKEYLQKSNLFDTETTA